MAEAGLPAFRGSQILQWVYAQTVCDPAAMSNLSKHDRKTIGRLITFLTGSVIAHQQSSDRTQKLLIRWSEQSEAASASPLTLPQIESAESTKTLETECVMIPTLPSKDGSAKVRRTACISSQVGCPVRCNFCASGLGGLDGNLSTGRIVEQVWQLNRILAEAAPQGSTPERITNIVFMGMGEPLSNYQAVVDAVRILTAEWAFNFSARRITISTVGLPAAIRRLAQEQLPVTLALSLHAPNDEIRRELIPWAEYATIDELLAACRVYFNATGREITFEYTLISGVNDQPEHAIQLARIVRSVRGNVNLIRYNEVDSLPYQRPEHEAVHTFQNILRERKVNVHIRASRGRDISAACGQLRHESKSESGI